MMNQELKSKWTAALRSGEYKQGQYRLRQTDNSYCCLGVLCNIVNPEGWHPRELLGDYYFIEGSENNNLVPENVTLPDYLRGRLDISVIEEGNLIDLNDNGSSFSEIADYIDANL